MPTNRAGTCGAASAASRCWVPIPPPRRSPATTHRGPTAARRGGSDRQGAGRTEKITSASTPAARRRTRIISPSRVQRLGATGRWQLGGSWCSFIGRAIDNANNPSSKSTASVSAQKKKRREAPMISTISVRMDGYVVGRGTSRTNERRWAATGPPEAW